MVRPIEIEGKLLSEIFKVIPFYLEKPIENLI